MRAIQAGNDVALANKETLVAGGKLVMQLAKEKGVRLTPIDSEHSAIFQCLQGCRDRGEIKRLILTCSGGPFYGLSLQELAINTKADALKHPNWSMGAKITIDSASMFNKALEIIEAHWLFDMPPEKIQVVVHPQSIVHSAVEFADGAVLAQLGVPDMRIPIQYALTWPDRLPSPVPELDFAALKHLSFDVADDETFRCLAATKKAIRKGGLAPAPQTVQTRKLCACSCRIRSAFWILAAWWKAWWTATVLAGIIPCRMCMTATAWRAIM